MHSSIDKRDRNRVKTVNFHIDYKHKDGIQISTVEVINVSSGGLCFLGNSTLKKSDIILLKLPFKSKKIILTGEVIRIEGREVAIKFLNTEKEIDAFIKTFKEEYSDIKQNNANSSSHFFDNHTHRQRSSLKDDLNNVFDID